MDVCKFFKILPNGLRCWKKYSLQGNVSDQFIEQWSEVSRQAEMSFLALVALHYREQHEGMERECYDIQRRWRPDLQVTDMKKLNDKTRTEYLKLMDRRLRKARTLCEKENIDFIGAWQTRTTCFVTCSVKKAYSIREMRKR